MQCFSDVFGNEEKEETLRPLSPFPQGSTFVLCTSIKRSQELERQPGLLYKRKAEAQIFNNFSDSVILQYLTNCAQDIHHTPTATLKHRKEAATKGLHWEDPFLTASKSSGVAELF